MSKIQLKLMAVLATLVVMVVGVSGVLAERSLRVRALADLDRALAERAALVDALTGDVPFTRSRFAELDGIADRAGRAAGARVTLIAPDGTVVGDSEVPLERLPDVVNHRDRPEVQAALGGRVGHSSRQSATVGRRLAYLAIPASGGRGVVRLAVDLSHLEASTAALRRELLYAGLLGLAAAVALSFGLAWIGVRPIHEMRRVAASIAGGRLDDRLPRGAQDELGEIANAINQMAEQLRERFEHASEEKDRMQAVLNAMVEGVLGVDAGRHVILANDRLREFYGVASDPSGRPALEVIRDAALDEILTEAAGGGGSVSREITVTWPRARLLRVQAAPLPAGGGGKGGVVAVFHDVTEISRLETVRRDFVANASHELRTPVAAIQGFAETLLAASALSEVDRRSYLQVIERHARRLGSLVGDLLELSRVESRAVRTASTDIDVGAAAALLVEDARPRTEAKSLTLELSCPAPAVAWADPRAVEQILANLLDNAISYTDPGGRIEVRIESGVDAVHVQVADTGIGIGPDDLQRIFERFYRVDKARSRQLGGTGLGLSIVKHWIQAVGGEITVESEPGKGSTFHVSLPRPLPS